MVKGSHRGFMASCREFAEWVMGILLHRGLRQGGRGTFDRVKGQC